MRYLAVSLIWYTTASHTVGLILRKEPEAGLFVSLIGFILTAWVMVDRTEKE